MISPRVFTLVLLMAFAFVTFAADGAISGNGSVNRFRARITVEEKTLKVGPLSSTRMAGPPEAMAQESKYLKALRSATSLRVEGDSLTIACADSNQPLTFTKTTNP